MAADNKVEIKLITDYRDCLLSKIESLKGSLGQIASSFGNEVSSSIDEFNKRMNIKLKTIDERFTKNTEELEALRAELLSKKFDEISEAKKLKKEGDPNSEIASIDKQSAIYIEISALMKSLSTELKSNAANKDSGGSTNIY
jgi:hypothetical protein